MKRSSISIKGKVTLAVIAAVVASTLLVGGLGQWQARDLVKTRVMESELPAVVNKMVNLVEREVREMLSVSYMMATDPENLAWLAQNEIENPPLL